MSYTPEIDPDPREEKLPRWARELLDNMRQRTRRAEATAGAARLETGLDTTDTLLYRYMSGDVGLPHGATIQFRLGEAGRDYIQCRVHRDTHGARLDLIGGGMLLISPHSSNRITIVTTK